VRSTTALVFVSELGLAVPELGLAVPELGLAVSATFGLGEFASTIVSSGSDFGRLNVAVDIHGVSVSLSNSSKASMLVRDATSCPS
jgi:hypothetical protein